MTAVDRPLTLAYLRVTPGLLRDVTRGFTGALSTTPPKPGEWAATDVVRHLVEGDRDTLLPRVRRMLAEDRPVFPKREPLRDDQSDLATLLDVFERARADIVKMLERLEPAAWLREGVSPSRGTLTVEKYAASTVAHDTEHLRQIQDARDALGLLPRRCEARVALSIAELARGLAGTSRRIAALAQGLGAAALRMRPREGEWCLTEVMAHLTDLERTLFLPRLRRMLAEQRPAFEPFDPKVWEQGRDHRARDFAADLDAFTQSRAETIAFLKGLPAGAESRLGVSGYFGPMTLAQYATHALDHDLEHLGQMADCKAVLASRG